jgi:hypothetical protein
MEVEEDVGDKLVLWLPEKAFPGEESASQIRGRRALKGFDCCMFGIEMDSVGWLRLMKGAPPRPGLV